MQLDEVRNFFNDHAATYKQKYNGQDAYYDYFFNGRMSAATDGFDYEGKRILDIGAGTGDLYNYINSHASEFDYYAQDIAGDMLAQSNIPSDRQFTAPAYELDLPVKEFDYIYMLGVTTYIEPPELAKIFAFIQKSLAPNGKLVLTFTNKNCIDYQLKKLAKKPLTWFRKSERVIAQQFKIHTYTAEEVKTFMAPQFRLRKFIFLNQTVFPFSRIMTKPSIKMAEVINKKVQDEKKLSWLSSDFLVVAEAKPL